MWIILGILIGSIFLGYLLRHKLNEKALGRLLLYSIFLLLFLLGVDIGSNNEILNALPILGFKALFIALGAIIGSIFFLWCIFRKFFNK